MENVLKKTTVHPLCITAICDHVTRVAMGGSKLPRDAPVVGILLGTMTESEISICDASDAIYDVESNGKSLSAPEVKLKVPEMITLAGLLKSVHPSQRVIGWYSVGSEPQPFHQHLHSQFLQFTESPPLLLLLNNQYSAPALVPSTTKTTPSLPLTLHVSSESSSSPLSPSSSFSSLPFTLDAVMTEKLTVDHVISSVVMPVYITSQLSSSSSTSSTSSSSTSSSSTSSSNQESRTPVISSKLEVQNSQMTKAVLTLRDKVGVLVRALQAMHAGAVPVDPHLLRLASSVCNQLTRLQGEPNAEGLAGEGGSSRGSGSGGGGQHGVDAGSLELLVNEGLIMAYLSASARALRGFSELSDAYAVLYADKMFANL